MRNFRGLLIYCLIVSAAIFMPKGAFGQTTSRVSPTELSDIQNPTILFVDMADAAQCLDLKLGDCDQINALASTYDIAKWIGTIVCNTPPISDCADCYSQIDGANIVGVLPIIKEELREPWFCDSVLQQNHSLVDIYEYPANYTPAYYATGFFSLSPWKQNVGWDDIRAFAGATGNTISKATLATYPTINNFSEYPMSRPLPVQYFNTPVVFGTTDSV